MGLRDRAESSGLGRALIVVAVFGGCGGANGDSEGDETQTLNLVRGRYGWKGGRCEAACMGVRPLAAPFDNKKIIIFIFFDVMMRCIQYSSLFIRSR